MKVILSDGKLGRRLIKLDQMVVFGESENRFTASREKTCELNPQMASRPEL